MISRMQKYLRAFGREDDGSATVEFTIVFASVLLMFFWAADIGITTTKQVLLEFGVDVVARDLRLGNLVLPPSPGGQSDMLKDLICDRVSILESCRDSITIEMALVDTNAWILPEREVACVDRALAVQPPTAFVIGQQNNLMIMKVCVMVKPMFPNIGLGAQLKKNGDGEFSLTAVTTFANEPTS